MDFIEACRQFIACDSSPAHGNRELAEKAAQFCREKGLDVEIQEESQSGLMQANVIARPKGLGRPTAEFMLQTHLDTVDPGPFQMWAQNGQNPFDAVIMDGCIYGLGAAEVKLDFLCKLEALSSLGAPAQWKLPPVLVGTYGEELGMTGALKLIRKNKVSATLALIGEPTDLRVVNAAKGFAAVEIHLPFSEEERRYRQEHDLRESTSTQSRIFHGKAAHSSTPQMGESAILKMLAALAQLPDGVAVMEIDGGMNFNTVPAHAFLEIEASTLKDSVVPKVRAIYKTLLDLEKEFETHVDTEFDPATPTLNIGIVRTLEDHIFIGGSCRIPPVITHNVYEAWMNRLAQVCEAQGGRFRVTDYKKPFRTPTNSMLTKACVDELKSMGLSGKTATQASTNEASLFSRLGMECVCFGPGVREDNTHTPREHVKIADLHRATDFYRGVLKRFCI